MPLTAANSSLRPYSAITFIFLYWNRFMRKLIASSGNFILCKTWCNGVIPMESKALLISWKATQSSLDWFFASSIILCNTWIGVFVFPPGSLPKFGPLRILCFKQKSASRVLIILTMIFLRHSKSIIGLVFSKQNCQSYGLGIRKICDVFHSVRIMALQYITWAKDRSISWTAGCSF